VDTNGNVIVTGLFQGTVDFGGGPLTSAGSYDIFVAKYSSSGAYLWAKRLGATNPDYGNGVTIDSNGDVIVTGAFYGTVDFGAGPITSISYGTFVAKYTASGGYVWADTFDGTGTQIANAVAVNGTSNVAVTGYFDNTMGTLTSAGGYDIFLLSILP
jgi:hypothetical protein